MNPARNKMGYWALGQLAVMTIMGFLGGGAAWLLGLPFAALIGLLTGLLEITPMLGTALMMIPVFFLGWQQSLGKGILAALTFFALSQFDGYVLSPKITGKSVKLPAYVIIMVIPIGAALYGAIGAILAVPIAAAGKVLTDDVLLPWLHRHEEEERQKSERAAA